jgi:hypothetical protein
MPKEETQVETDDATLEVETETTQETGPVEDPEPGPGDDEAGAEELGDAGKQALDRMKAKWQAERKKNRELQAKLDEVTDAPQPDPAEILAAANARILRSEIKAAAAGKLADPTDALRFLDLEQFEVGDDGDVDEDEIADAISDLLKNKPYLGAQGGRRFQGTADGGARKDTSPTQLTEADLARMSPEEIVQAKTEGRFNKLLGIE